MTKHYFVNKQTGRRYEIVKIKDHEVTLKGEYREFTVPDNVNIKRMGYTLEKVESDA